MSSHSALSK